MKEILKGYLFSNIDNIKNKLFYLSEKKHWELLKFSFFWQALSHESHFKWSKTDDSKK